MQFQSGGDLQGEEVESGEEGVDVAFRRHVCPSDGLEKDLRISQLAG